MKKILITDAVDKKSVPILESAGFEVTYKPGMPKEEIKQIIKDYNALIVRSETKVTPDIIELMDNMEVIGRAGTGVDNIDTAAATRKGIIVMNTPGGNTISTAEHSMALLLSMCRNIAMANYTLRNGKWDKKTYKGTELQNKTIGIVGLGRIGREVANRCKGFEMHVIGYDPVLSPELAGQIGIEVVSLEEIFKRSDIITVHVPLTAETKHLIRKETLATCKDGVKIINCARGGIVKEDDLLEALENGKVSAAALDVYEVEPPDLSGKLIQHPKVTATPHLGASTDEAQEKVALQIAEEIVDLFNKKIVRGAINAAAVEALGKPELAPYVKLSESIGSLLSQLLSGTLKKININYSGDLLHTYSTLASTSVLKGFLSKKVTGEINLINAPFLAKEMGIEINEIKSGPHPDYASLITVEFVSGKESHKLAGTVFGKNEVKIVEIDDFHLELTPEGTMIFFKNMDKPGVFASIGKTLAASGVNIAGVSLGRLGIGKEAVIVVNVDSAVEQAVVEQLGSISGVTSISVAEI